MAKSSKTPEPNYSWARKRTWIAFEIVATVEFCKYLHICLV